MIDFIDLYKCAEGSMCCVADNCMSYIEINSSLTFKKIYSLIKILIVTKWDCQRDYYMWHEMANVVCMHVIWQSKKRQEKKQQQQQQQRKKVQSTHAHHKLKSFNNVFEKVWIRKCSSDLA